MPPPHRLAAAALSAACRVRAQRQQMSPQFFDARDAVLFRASRDLALPAADVAARRSC